jgi:hypothetical protein
MLRRTLPPTFLFLLYSIFKEPAMTKATAHNTVQPYRPNKPDLPVRPERDTFNLLSLICHQDRLLRIPLRKP